VTKSAVPALIGMIGLAGLIPAAVVVWGLWSLPTLVLTAAVLCAEVYLVQLLGVSDHEQQRVARFGKPLRFALLPRHDGPLPVRRAARRPPPARPDRRPGSPATPPGR
jgi:hypothetical protein